MAAPKLKYGLGNSASTTLGSGITNTDTTAPLTSDTNFQAKSGEGMALLDEGAVTEELAYSTGLSGGALAIPLANRGLEGGSAQAHSGGASVKGIYSVGMWNDAIDSMLNILDQTTGDIDHAEITSALYAADSGANDTYVITLSPAPANYAAITGLPITFKANTVNTGAATLNVNTLGAKTIKKLHDQDLNDGDIEAGQAVTVVYDGTDFQMQSQIANSGESITTTKGDLAGYSTTSARVPVSATNGRALIADSGASLGVSYADGAVIQVVAATYATSTNNTTTTYADTGLTASITPKFASSKILVMVTQSDCTESAGQGLKIQLLRGASSIYVPTLFASVQQSRFPITFQYLDSPATASATTYKTQFAGSGGSPNATVQVGNSTSSIILMEIAG